MSNIYNLYTLDELKSMAEIYDSVNCKYLPVVPIKNKDYYSSTHTIVDVLNMETSALCKEYTLKFYYALQVWNMAVSILNQRATTVYPNGLSYRFGYEWVPESDAYGFNKLVSQNPNYELLINVFGIYYKK